MLSAAPDPPRAGVLLIGNELLTGKIRDENGHVLARMLRRRGIQLVEMAVVGDDQAAIGEALLRLCARSGWVFTSGGVGPTHDDVTLAAIASATGRPLVRNQQMETQLRNHYGAGLSDAALRMADLPQGTQLRAESGWPVFRLDLEVPAASRVYMLPGVPGLLRAKLEHLEGLGGELPEGSGWHVAVLHTTLDESRLAPALDRIVAGYPAVEVGSYPRWCRAPDGQIRYHVRVTFEAPTERAREADEACARLAATVPADALVEPDAPV